MVPSGAPVFRYTRRATPVLWSVVPQVAGPGTKLRLHALACDGLLSATPIELVSATFDAKLRRAKDLGAQAAGSDLIFDPEEAWGHICIPYSQPTPFRQN